MATKKSVSEYEVTYENQGGTYQFSTKVKSKTNQITSKYKIRSTLRQCSFITIDFETVEELPPGTKFRFVIVAVHNGMYGAPFKGFFSTKGNQLELEL